MARADGVGHVAAERGGREGRSSEIGDAARHTEPGDPLHAPCEIGVEEAQHDPQLGILRPRDERRLEIGDVVVGDAEQVRGVLNAKVAEHGRLRGVAHRGRDPGRARPWHPQLVVEIDAADGNALGLQLGGDAEPDRAEPADDRVPAQPPRNAEHVRDSRRDHRVGHEPDHERERGDADDQHGAVIELEPAGRVWVQLVAPQHGRDAAVQRLGHGEVLHRRIQRGRQRDQGEQDQAEQPQPAIGQQETRHGGDAPALQPARRGGGAQPREADHAARVAGRPGQHAAGRVEREQRRTAASGEHPQLVPLDVDALGVVAAQARLDERRSRQLRGRERAAPEQLLGLRTQLEIEEPDDEPQLGPDLARGQREMEVRDVVLVAEHERVRRAAGEAPLELADGELPEGLGGDVEVVQLLERANREPLGAVDEDGSAHARAPSRLKRRGRAGTDRCA